MPPLLGGRSRGLLCEELALRARLDLDQGRPGHAAVELDGALTRSGRRAGASRSAPTSRCAWPSSSSCAQGVRQGRLARCLRDGGRARTRRSVEHALGRLEAALRARTAPGV